MSSSALENEDLDNVPLVRMEDVQPSRNRLDRVVNDSIPCTDDGEVYEAYIIEEYEKASVSDEDSNIGSMVSIRSDDIPDDSDSGELIVPDIQDPPIEIHVPLVENNIKKEVRPNLPVSWPTLEILPGGVIKNANEYESDLNQYHTKMNNSPAQGEMMYACAKCSQTFKYLFCLVKHVKWHEDQDKVMRTPPVKKMSPLEKELVYIRRERNKLEKTYKQKKVQVLARIATAIGKFNNTKDFINK